MSTSLLAPSLHAQGAPPAGFTDPVQQSQIAFRAMLNAMARPGQQAAIATDVGHPPGLAPALAATILTLCDLDTPVWLGPGLDSSAVRGWLAFHTGAPVAAEPVQAAVVVLAAGQVGSLEDFSFGTDEAPERGATLLIQVPDLQGPEAMVWRGPGIRDAVAMPFCGLPESFWRQRAMLTGAFPRGLDIYLAHGRDLIGLPRSTTIAIAGV